MTNIIDFLKGLRGDRQPTEDEQRLAECFASGALTTASPFWIEPSPAPTWPSRYTYQSSTGEVYVLKEAGRALLADLDSQPDWAMEWGPDPDVVERFRALLEPK